ncbi:MAG: D-serine ammonia-lyase [Clostridia bacterium]|nr:D-serine ammonia-lyase [Clostridia bacterium]
MLKEKLARLEEVCWRNDGIKPAEIAIPQCELKFSDIEAAAARWQRFASYFKVAFPETEATDGILESPLREIPEMKAYLEKEYATEINGGLWLKMDSHLPVSGSIKARGGVYEVLATAEEIALREGLITLDSDYSVFADEKIKSVLSRYSIAVGSTGNLGLSIGIMSAKLGFRVTVHMSSDAREWKKNMLRTKGVKVVEYESDYSEAVRKGREEAEKDPYCHFIDDENSKTLFLGYSVAALRLKKQLEEKGIKVDADHPLNVYLPCGVGGGPGGVAFGLKQMFGDNVHCFFAEPVSACCMILGMSTGLHSKISTEDIGITARTAADGLAVGRASGFVGRLMEPFMSGCYTLTDERMCRLLAALADSEDIFLEPSALAGMYGPILTESSEEFGIFGKNKNRTHIVWATGGSMVPADEMKKYYLSGK